MTKRTAERPLPSTWRAPLRRGLSLGVMTLLGSGVACKARKDAPPPPPVAAADSTPAEEAPEPAPTPAPVAMPVAALPVEEFRPACDQYQLTDNGVAALRVGDPRELVSAKCRLLTDSTAHPAGEGDAGGRSSVVVGVNGSPLVVELDNDRVYRLAVTDSLFRTADGLGPGVAVSRLLELPGAMVLEGVHDLSIVVDAHCGLYFRVTKPPTTPEGYARWSDYLRAQPPTTPVERVVVHGCRAPVS